MQNISDSNFLKDYQFGSIPTNFRSFLFCHALQLTCAHCSHLDIYISQKTRPCVVNLEGQFQTSLEAKLSNLLIPKLRSIILIFLLFFAEIVKSSAFCTLLLLFQIASKLQFVAKTWLKYVDVCKFNAPSLEHTKPSSLLTANHYLYRQSVFESQYVWIFSKYVTYSSTYSTCLFYWAIVDGLLK